MITNGSLAFYRLKWQDHHDFLWFITPYQILFYLSTAKNFFHQSPHERVRMAHSEPDQDYPSPPPRK